MCEIFQLPVGFFLLLTDQLFLLQQCIVNSKQTERNSFFLPCGWGFLHQEVVVILGWWLYIEHWTIRIKWTFSWASITRSPMWRHFQPLSQRVSRCCRQLKTHNCAGWIWDIWSKPNHTQMGLFMCSFEMSCENNADFLLGFVFCIIISPLLLT